MRGRVMKAAVVATLAISAASAANAALAMGGTVAITSPTVRDGEPPATVSTEAAARAFGMRGFTILNDPAHAAYVAEVVTTRTAVGTAVAQGSSERPLANAGGVSIPIAGGKSVLVPLQRTRLEIRIRRRGDRALLWHGSAVTVRSAGMRDGGAAQVAFALSQAALSSYPTQTTDPISIP